MLITRATDIRSSEIIDKRLYHSRRDSLQAAELSPPLLPAASAVRRDSPVRPAAGAGRAS